MKIRDRYTGHRPEGEFVLADDYLDGENDPVCPVCGAEPGQQCSVPDPDNEFLAIETGPYIHAERAEVPDV